ncbi:hypothetical protein MPRF_03530 [Mycolicibacterium parafortuitum]|uniref:DUF3060 domain-containing protein n=2 Tax=Mycolicibacterium parafortuitum TaxID=39692 RepID=A0A7I7TWX8_MYCPF|nr:hypothetical protein MPRF_03530 [Mycolicibacterium parafortuitum]
MCNHLRMEPDGDPEARIRDLERPLADRARANELGTQPYRPDSTPPTYRYVPPSESQGTYPVPPPLPPVSEYPSPYYAAPQHVVHKKHSVAVWLIPVALLVCVVTAAIGIAVYFNTGSPAVSGFPPPAPPAPPPQVPSPIDATEQVITAGAGGLVSIGGVGKTQTIVCDQGTVSISGVDNTIEVAGHCALVNVSGVENHITVESSDVLNASGFDNRITFRDGDPEITTSGAGNVIERG